MVVVSVVAVCPFLLFPRPTWLLVGLLVPSAWLVTYLRQGYLLTPTPLTVFLVPLLAMLGVSIYASYDLAVSLNKIAGTLLGIFVFFATVQICRGRTHNQALTILLLTAAMAMAAFASLFFTHWKPTIPFLAGLARRIPFGFQELPGLDARINPNPVGGAVILVIPVLLMALHYLHLSRNQRSRLQNVSTMLSGMAVGVLLLTVTLLSQSYSAWSGFSAGALLIGLGLPILLQTERCKYLVVYARIGILTIIGAGFVLVTFPTTLGVFFDLHNREIVWEAALKGTQDFPLTGLGLSAFPDLTQILYPVVLSGRILNDLSSTHNLALQSCIDLGFPGAIVLIGIWAASLRALWLVLLTSPRTFSRCLALGCLGGLTAQLYYQITDSIPLGTKVGLLWWAMLGLGMSLFSELDDHKIKDPNLIGSLEIILLWALSSLLAVLAAGVEPRAGVGIAVCAGCGLGCSTIMRRKKPSKATFLVGPYEA